MAKKTTKHMLSFKGQPASFKELIKRFGYGVEPEGFKVLGFWHSFSGVYVVVETEDIKPLYAYVAKWSDLVTFTEETVLDTKEAAEALEDYGG